MVYDSFLRSLFILLLTAIAAKLIGPYATVVSVDKRAIERESRYVEWPCIPFSSLYFDHFKLEHLHHLHNVLILVFAKIW